MGVQSSFYLLAVEALDMLTSVGLLSFSMKWAICSWQGENRVSNESKVLNQISSVLQI